MDGEAGALRHLPAIYQVESTAFDESPREGAPHVDVVGALLGAWDDTVGQLGRIVDRLEYYVDPGTTPPELEGAHTSANDDFLGFLATWVGVDLSEVDVDDARPPDIRTLGQRQRWLVGHAAELYRIRGTKKGLQKILQAYYDIEVDIHEWACPEGLRIGVSSVIGIDTVLMPEVDRRSAFVVVWKPTKPLALDLEHLKQWCLRITRESGRPARAAVTVVRAQMLNSAGRWIDDPHWNELSLRLRTRVQRIRAAIDRERPANTSCYLALGWDETPPPWPAGMLRIEVESKIEGFVIESGRKIDGVPAD